MNDKYHFDHGPSRHRSHKTVIILVSSFLVIVALGSISYLVFKLTTKPISDVSGPAKLVGQATSPGTNSQTFEVSETDFTIKLPVGWHSVPSIAGVNNPDTKYSNSWQSSGYNGTSRFLSVYVDNIPTNYPLNLILPIRSASNKVIYGTLSDNCTNFTVANTSNPTQAEWEGVNFICNLADKIDDQVGTGTTGSAINTTTIMGPITGNHNYFFLYIDRSASPNYAIFYNILSSFQAK